MVSPGSGLAGGLVATLVMTAFMMALGGDSPPPTAVLWAKYVGDGDPGDYEMHGMVLHLVYGVVAGAVFAVVFTAFDLGFAIDALAGGLAWGVVYGLVLFAVAAAFWMNIVLEAEADAGAIQQFLVFHLVYGVVLGAWTGLGGTSMVAM